MKSCTKALIVRVKVHFELSNRHRRGNNNCFLAKRRITDQSFKEHIDFRQREKNKAMHLQKDKSIQCHEALKRQRMTERCKVYEGWK